MYAYFSALELDRARGHVQSPDAIDRHGYLLQSFFPSRFKSPDPLAQGQRVMGAQPFHVVDFEAFLLYHTQDVAHRVEFAVREHVAVDEFGGHRLAPTRLVMGDAVVEKEPARFKQPVRSPEIQR